VIVIISSFRIDRFIMFITVDGKVICDEVIIVDKVGGATHKEP
jgi:hypothetical protein